MPSVDAIRLHIRDCSILTTCAASLSRLVSWPLLTIASRSGGTPASFTASAFHWAPGLWGSSMPDPKPLYTTCSPGATQPHRGRYTGGRPWQSIRPPSLLGRRLNSTTFNTTRLYPSAIMTDDTSFYFTLPSGLNRVSAPIFDLVLYFLFSFCLSYHRFPYHGQYGTYISG